MALNSIAGISNKELWDLSRKASPSFASHTSKATAELFTEKGFDAISRSNLNVINEFFELSLRVGFQLLETSKARNPLAEIGLVEVFDTPNGGFVQRISVHSVKPVSPRFKGLENGDSVDQWTVRKPEADERFFQQNFDYQSFITVQEYQVKQIFINEYGMGAFVAGIMEGLRNGYTIQEYENTIECLSAAINSTTHPLQDTQVYNVDTWGSGTDGEITGSDLMNLVKVIKDVATAMATKPQTSAYNAAKFATLVDQSDLILLTRAGIKTEIELKLELGAFNPDRLTLPFEVHEVDNFGGLVAYKDAEFKKKLYPVYSSIGEQVGWAETEGATTATVADGEAYYKDPNEDVLAVLIQRGAIFENSQNPYRVIPTGINAAGLYQNYWASRPNTAIVYDHNRTVVVFRKPKDE